MIIVKLTGGLGNQMFQYAYGKALSLRDGIEVRFDTSWYEKMNPLAIEKDTPRTYSLGAFAANIRLATPEDISPFDMLAKSLYRKISKKIRTTFSNSEQKARDGAYLEGSWASESYFADHEDAIRQDFALRDELSPMAKSMKEIIGTSSPSVSLHVRRGDYVTDLKTQRYHGSCDIAYYEKALDKVASIIGCKTEDLHLFIFSDDIQWSREHLHLKAKQMHFVSHPLIPDHEEMHLMSLCDHHIIANSTFSWWGAWLDPRRDKIVITPAAWTKKQSRRYKDVVPSDWIKIQ